MRLRQDAAFRCDAVAEQNPSPLNLRVDLFEAMAVVIADTAMDSQIWFADHLSLQGRVTQ